MRALFGVGEEIILDTMGIHPGMGGDATVISVCENCERRCGICHRNIPGYQLTISTGDSEYPFWCECALRKKQEPGESFDSVMQGLKKPIDEPVFIEK